MQTLICQATWAFPFQTSTFLVKTFFASLSGKEFSYSSTNQFTVCFFLCGWLKKKSISSLCVTPVVWNKLCKSNVDSMNSILVMHRSHKILELGETLSGMWQVSVLFLNIQGTSQAWSRESLKTTRQAAVRAGTGPRLSLGAHFFCRGVQKQNHSVRHLWHQPAEAHFLGPWGRRNVALIQLWL